MKFDLDQMIFAEVRFTLERLLGNGCEKSEITDSFVLKKSNDGEIINVYKRYGKFYFTSNLSEYRRHIRKLERISTDSVSG